MSERRPVVELLDPLVVECLKRMTPAQRLAQVSRLWRSARIIIRGSVRQQHPDWSEAHVDQEVAWRMSRGATERVPR